MSRGEQAHTTHLIYRAAEILGAEHPMTIRQLFYRLVSVHEIPNSAAGYNKVKKTMTTARNDGRIPFDHIVDRSRPEYSKNVFKDAAAYAEVVAHAYHKDYWETQPNYVEIWSEKDTITGSIEELTKDLGVLLRVNRGYLSTTQAHERAAHFDSLDKSIYVLYLGDHDPSGVDMQRDCEMRVLQNCQLTGFNTQRLAIFQSDIDKFNLPPLRVKNTDSRTPGFEIEHGPDCVELDALPPVELRRRIQMAIESFRNEKLWSRALEVEKQELECIRAAGEWFQPKSKRNHSTV